MWSALAVWPAGHGTQIAAPPAFHLPAADSRLRAPRAPKSFFHSALRAPKSGRGASGPLAVLPAHASQALGSGGRANEPSALRAGGAAGSGQPKPGSQRQRPSLRLALAMHVRQTDLVPLRRAPQPSVPLWRRPAHSPPAPHFLPPKPAPAAGPAAPAPATGPAPAAPAAAFFSAHLALSAAFSAFHAATSASVAARHVAQPGGQAVLLWVAEGVGDVI